MIAPHLLHHMLSASIPHTALIHQPKKEDGEEMRSVSVWIFVWGGISNYNYCYDTISLGTVASDNEAGSCVARTERRTVGLRVLVVGRMTANLSAARQMRF